MKRNPRKQKWTRAWRNNTGKELVNDNVFEFEKRRNVPLKYNRDTIAQTVKVMARAEEIKERRRKDFYEARMKDTREMKKTEMLRDIKIHGHLMDAEDRKAERKKALAENKEAEMQAEKSSDSELVKPIDLEETEQVKPQKQVIKVKASKSKQKAVGSGRKDTMDLDN